MEFKNGLSPDQVTKSEKLKYYLNLSDRALGCNLSTDEDKVMTTKHLGDEAKEFSKSKTSNGKLTVDLKGKNFK